MKNEFVLAFNEVLEEKQLPKEIILKALESAMISAYRRAVNASNAQTVEAKVDIETGKVTIYAEKEVVDSVQDERTEVTLTEARRVNPEAEIGDMVIVESTPRDFGRVAAQTARQVIQQRIRDAERSAQLAHYEKQLGEIISGVVQAVGATGLTIGLDMKAEGNMPRKEMIPGERFRIHDRVRALVAEAKDTPRGPQIILSRTHRNFLRRLLETEVPEIYHGVVEIRSIAREPGERAKVAVSATQQGIDPVGACVGIRGVRIQAIVRELHDEKIDVIEWNSDPAIFIAKAISPARVSGVYLSERAASGKTATVVVPEDQLSLAIGRDGQNARLAAKLTGWRIDIKSLPEAAVEAFSRLNTEHAVAGLFDNDPETVTRVQDMLGRKAEGRPLTPEEYDIMTHFVDRVERRISARLKAEKKAEEEARAAELRDTVPAGAFSTNILESGLSEHVIYTLQDAGYNTIGDLALQMKASADTILRLQGIGPRAMQEITALMERLEAEARSAPVVVEPEVTAPVVEEVPAVVEAAPAVTEPAVEATPAPVVEEETPAVPEDESTFEQWLVKAPEITAPAVASEEEEEDQSDKKDKKKGKKKGKFVEVTYDPDKDQTTARKKHRRDGGGWEWEE